MSKKSDLILKKKNDLINIILRKDDVEIKLKEEIESLNQKIDDESNHSEEIKNNLIKTEEELSILRNAYNNILTVRNNLQSKVQGYKDSEEAKNKKIETLEEKNYKNESAIKTYNAAVIILAIATIIGFIL